MRTSSFVVSLVALSLLAGPCLAAEEGGGRYTMTPMTPTDNGVVRLDTQTGVMALCTGSDGHWSCQDMNDSQRTLTSEIDKLRAENKSLKEQVEQMEQTLGLAEGGPDAPKPPGKFTLPTEEDVDTAFDYLERMLKKLQGRMEKLKEKHENGTGKAL